MFSQEPKKSWALFGRPLVGAVTGKTENEKEPDENSPDFILNLDAPLKVAELEAQAASG